MLLVEISHVIAESPFELPIGLWMAYSRMNQPDARSITERGKKVSLEAFMISKSGQDSASILLPPHISPPTNSLGKDINIDCICLTDPT
jgi:hypothetical protein